MGADIPTLRQQAHDNVHVPDRISIIGHTAFLDRNERKRRQNPYPSGGADNRKRQAWQFKYLLHSWRARTLVVMDNDTFVEAPEPFEDDLETFERNATAADDGADRRAAEEDNEDELPDELGLVEELRSEFALLGYQTPSQVALERMAHLLAEQQVDFGPVGITACALGWIAHAQSVRAL
jgi:hypothetical protein